MIAMRQWLVVCLATLASVGPGAAVSAQSPPARSADTRHVRVELIADRASLQPGEQWLGVKFTLEPGWHIYSINPGDSGAPPEVRWQLPAGVAASPFEWPAARRIEVGGLVDVGYLDSVVLPVKLTVAARAAVSPAVVEASLRWLMCKNICTSGQAAVALRWPLAAADRAAAASWREEIAHARSLVPPAGRQPAP
jgi:thiol:disulfide interchange protein DsbD